MRKHIINCPINTLGFGIISLYVITELIFSSPTIDLEIIPIGEPDLSAVKEFEEQYFFAQPTIRSKIKKVSEYIDNEDNVVIYIWHPAQLTDHLPSKSYRKMGITFFEKSRLNHSEINGLKKVNKILQYSEWGINVLKYFGIPGGRIFINNSILSEPGQGKPSMWSDHSEQAKEIISPLVQADNINIYSGGKWETRKGQDKLIDNIINVPGKITIFGCWENPFLNGLEKPISHLVTTGWKLEHQGTIFKKTGYVFLKEEKRIILLPRIESYRASLGILGACDMMISLSSAEGLDLHMIEAKYIAHKPVLVSHNTAYIDYVCQTPYPGLTLATEEQPAFDGIWFHGEGVWYPPKKSELNQLNMHITHCIATGRKLNSIDGVYNKDLYAYSN